MPTANGTSKTPVALASGVFRQIGFLPLLAVFFGYTCGGPFGYEEIFKDSGPGMAIVFLALVPFFWSIPISLASAELNSIMPVQGGFYRWTRAAFGDFWGFQCGWWNWTGTFLLNSAYGAQLMDYVKNYYPQLTDNERWLGACAILILLAIVNARGIKVAGWLAVVLQTAVFIPVIWLCVVALFHWHHNPMLPFSPPGKQFVGVFGSGLAIAMWNYAGYEQLSSVTQEMKDPQRTFTRLIAWNTPLCVITYILPAALALAVLGNWHDWITGYIVDASRLVGGETLGAAMLVASIIGTLALSNSTILYTTRIPATMAEDGFLSAWLGKIHARWGTPARAIAVSAIIYCVLAKFDVVPLVDIYIWTRIATSMLTLLSAWRMRRKAPNAPRRFRVPAGKIGMAYVVIVPAILCAIKIAYSEPFVMRYSPLLLATGPVAYLILRFVFRITPRPTIEPVGSAAPE
ncbi:MAG TPA: APC family permease [Candidatus Acidoferrales bacterium]|nr:APC family permease [Candidatus Acidoferrales bacterium]